MILMDPCLLDGGSDFTKLPHSFLFLVISFCYLFVLGGIAQYGSCCSFSLYPHCIWLDLSLFYTFSLLFCVIRWKIDFVCALKLFTLYNSKCNCCTTVSFFAFKIRTLDSKNKTMSSQLPVLLVLAKKLTIPLTDIFFLARGTKSITTTRKIHLKIGCEMF